MRRAACHVDYKWDASDLPAGAVFAPELSLARSVDGPACSPTSKSGGPTSRPSRGVNGDSRTIQGVSITPVWPVQLGAAALELGGGELSLSVQPSVEPFDAIAEQLAALSRQFYARGWALGTSGNFQCGPQSRAVPSRHHEQRGGQGPAQCRPNRAN